MKTQPVFVLGLTAPQNEIIRNRPRAGIFGLFVAMLAAMLPLVIFVAGCRVDDGGVFSAHDDSIPFINATDPAFGATGVPLNKVITVTFSEAMDSTSLNGTSLRMSAPNGANVPGVVTYSRASYSATLRPSSNLTGNTAYTVIVTTGARDLSGNAIASNYVWNFVTSTAPDLTPPTVIATDPVNNEVDVALNNLISATFSEEIDVATLTATSFTVTGPEAAPVVGVIGYSGPNRTVTFRPSSNLAGSTVYNAKLTTDIKDLTGNPMSTNFDWTFTTGLAADVSPPTVTFTDPQNRAEDEALNTAIAATFSEGMDALTLNTLTFLVTGPAATPVLGTVAYAGPSFTMIFTPSFNLTTFTTYRVTVTTGVKDRAGNAMTGNYEWSFKTGVVLDVTAPTVVYTDPANNETSEPLNNTITATFSERMDPLGITLANFRVTGQGNTPVAGTIVYESPSFMAVFTPDADLTANTVYTATITSGVEDLAGNALVNDYVWSFTTSAVVDVTAPTVVSTDPASDASDIMLNHTVTAKFSEGMDALMINPANFRLRGPGNANVLGNVAYVGPSFSAIFTPSNNLAANTVYTATITTGVRDRAGNRLASDYVWSFTTGSVVDATPPRVVSVDPANNATLVPPNIRVTATFNEGMDAQRINGVTFLLRGSDDVLIPGAVVYDEANFTALFTPDNNLAANSSFTATITTGVRDRAGNALEQNFVWSFTTGTVTGNIRPTVVSTNPQDEALDVVLNGTIAATFSERMDAMMITPENFMLTGPGAAPVAGSVAYVGPSFTAIFTPTDNLAAQTIYTATIRSNVRDLAGNELAADYVWHFTSGTVLDNTPPRIVSTNPADNATLVPLNQMVTATFSEMMDAQAINEGTFTVSGPNDILVEGSVTYNGARFMSHFTPNDNLAPSTRYIITISDEVRDGAGNALAENFVWSFTTGSAIDIIRPTVTSTDPRDDAVDVALNRTITATFSERMNALTISSVNFMVTGSGNQPVNGSVAYAGPSATAIFTPDENLSARTLYTATITTNARDLAGNQLATNYVWKFTSGETADITPPTVVTTDPEDHEQNVPVDEFISIIFSEAMDPLRIDETRFRVTGSGNASVAGQVSYIGRGSTAIFEPDQNLLANTTYTATMDSSVKDLAGNSLGRIYVWNFTTGASPDSLAPTVITIEPADEEVDVILTKTIVVVFNEPMDGTTIDSTTMTITYGGGVEIDGAVTYNVQTHTASFNPSSDLVVSTRYTATVGSLVTDAAGNELDNDYVWTFTTVAAPDSLAPVLFLANPEDGEADVALDRTIRVTFNERIKSTTINSRSFIVTVGGVEVDGERSCEDSTATFTPVTFLLSNSTYTVTVTTNVEDIAGNRIENNYHVTFSTIASAGPAPVDLGSAENFAIIGNTWVHNSGLSVVDGNLGISPCRAVIGFPPGRVVNGEIHISDEVARTAREDLTAAYIDARDRAEDRVVIQNGVLDGLTLAPGLYQSAPGTFILTNQNLTLDAEGDVNATWIFQMATSLTVMSNRQVILTGGAKASNIHWQVGSSATIGTNAVMKGNIIAQASITLQTGASLLGRAVTQAAEITLDNNAVTKP